ncbi:MAG: hypothetical protein ACPLRW_04810 [Moorellales bacterium]
MFVFPLIGLGLIAAVLLVFLRLKKQVAADPTADARTAQDFLGLDDVRDGVVVLAAPEGSARRQYRAVLEVSAVNYKLFSDKEQNAVEDAFAGFLASLTFPVQFFVQTRLLDMHERVEHLRGLAFNLEGALREYALGLAAYLEELMAMRSIMTKRAYVVIPAEAQTREEAARELARRAELVAAGLARCGLACRRLGSFELAEILYVLMNKDRAPYARLEQAEQHGFLSLYVAREERVVDGETEGAFEAGETGRAGTGTTAA